MGFFFFAKKKALSHQASIYITLSWKLERITD